VADFCGDLDAKKLVTVTKQRNGSEFTIVVWNYEKQRCIAFVDCYNQVE
jgi:WD40 repeat protein